MGRAENLALLAAANNGDVAAALAALNRGADKNCRDDKARRASICRPHAR
jgi:hypothetical protein